jgi:hypothetical protein
MSTGCKKMSREWDLNPRPAVYETAALPLSYLGKWENAIYVKIAILTVLKNHDFEEV